MISFESRLGIRLDIYLFLSINKVGFETEEMVEETNTMFIGKRYATVSISSILLSSVTNSYNVLLSKSFSSFSFSLLSFSVSTFIPKSQHYKVDDTKERKRKNTGGIKVNCGENR